jgi:hypothetical protein
MFDSVHGELIANPGVPAWWPAFCLAYDVTAAAYLAWILSRRKVRADSSASSVRWLRSQLDRSSGSHFVISGSSGLR